MPTGPRSPAAARTSRFRWQDPRLALGLGIIGLCCLLGSRILSSAEDTVSVWAARSDLQQGQPVGGADLVRREVRFDDQGDADRYLSADTELPADATVDRAVGSGELLPRSALDGAASGPVTEVPVAVRAEAVPASVHVGSTVDVWVTPTPALAGSAGSRAAGSGSAGSGSPGSGSAGSGSAGSGSAGSGSAGEGAGRSTLVFHDVAVVSAPRSATSLGPTGTRQVTVGIPGTDNGRLSRSMAALAGGDVTLTSRR